MKDSYNCEEDFTLIDQRLAISTIACAFSLFALAYDYIFPFPQSKPILLICSVRYPLQCISRTLRIHKHTYAQHHASHLHIQSLVFIFDYATYFILMGVLSAFMMYKEKNTFYVGLEKDPAGVVCSLHLVAHICLSY